jgi:hypothetical protein
VGFFSVSDDSESDQSSVADGVPFPSSSLLGEPDGEELPGSRAILKLAQIASSNFASNSAFHRRLSRVAKLRKKRRQGCWD